MKAGTVALERARTVSTTADPSARSSLALLAIAETLVANLPVVVEKLDAIESLLARQTAVIEEAHA